MATMTPMMLEQLALQPLAYQRTIWETRLAGLWRDLHLHLLMQHDEQTMLLLDELKSYLSQPVCREVALKMRLGGKNDLLSKVISLLEDS